MHRVWFCSLFWYLLLNFVTRCELWFHLNSWLISGISDLRHTPHRLPNALWRSWWLGNGWPRLGFEHVFRALPTCQCGGPGTAPLEFHFCKTTKLEDWPQHAGDIKNTQLNPSTNETLFITPLSPFSFSVCSSLIGEFGHELALLHELLLGRANHQRQKWTKWVHHHFVVPQQRSGERIWPQESWSSLRGSASTSQQTVATAVLLIQLKESCSYRLWASHRSDAFELAAFFCERHSLIHYCLKSFKLSGEAEVWKGAADPFTVLLPGFYSEHFQSNLGCLQAEELIGNPGTGTCRWTLYCPLLFLA